MMKNEMALILVLGSMFFMGCQGFVTREALREQEQKREITDKVSTLQRSTADVNNRFADIEADQREIHGKVEVLENRMSQSSQAHEKYKKNSEELNSENQKKINVLQEEIAKMQDQISSLATELSAVKSAPAIGEKSETKNEKASFEIAEEHFDKKEWRKAILNYQKFREMKPKDKKVPEAIYKIGVSFQEMNMKDESKTFYDELIAKYPNSSEAKKAKIRIKKIK